MLLVVKNSSYHILHSTTHLPSLLLFVGLYFTHHQNLLENETNHYEVKGYIYMTEISVIRLFDKIFTGSGFKNQCLLAVFYMHM